MRRKSDRSKAASVVSSPEKNTPSRRSTRRGKKSPSPSPERDETIQKSDDEVKNVSDSESEEEKPKRKRKLSRTLKTVDEAKTSKTRRRRGGKIDQIATQVIEEETSGNENDNGEIQEVVAQVQVESKESSPEKEVEEEEATEEVKDAEEVTPEITEVADSPEKEDSPEPTKSRSPSPVKEKTKSPSKSPSPVDKRRSHSREKKRRSASKSSSREKIRSRSKERKRHISIEKSPSPIQLKEKSPSPKPEESEIEPTTNEDEVSPMEVEASELVEEKEKTPEKQLIKETEVRKSSEKKSEVKKTVKPIRKRKWLSRTNSESKTPVLTISTDSLKNLISDVKPVALCDVKLESSPEPEEPVENQEEILRAQKRRERSERRKESVDEEKISPAKSDSKQKSDDFPSTTTRKVSIIEDLQEKVQQPPSPPRHNSSNVLYITNLVRPFTVLQLKGLLARTGKIVENGFWIDKIKSRCYVKYESEDEATETRHALHGVRWPTSNPKLLNVDFGTEGGMEKALQSTVNDVLKAPGERSRDDFVSWDRDRIEMEEKKDVAAVRPVREWDVGKTDGPERIRDRDHSRDRNERGQPRKRSTEREFGRDHNRRRSQSPARKFKKKEDDPPLRLLDDLFRKTKTTPCIYWLPLTTEQISIKEDLRKKHLVEHQRKIEEQKRIDEERDLERKKERENREKERERERDRDKDRSRNRSTDRRRDRSSDRVRSSRDRGGDDRRRYNR